MKNPFTFDGKRNAIAGVGSALVDLCINESAGFVKKAGAAKGGMVTVDHTHIEEVLTKTDAVPSVVPGGSACNTIVGIAKLGYRAKFIGKRGDDKLGEQFEQSITADGVEPTLLKSDDATGRVLSIVTPDAQRSMLTYLGASAKLLPADIKSSYFKDCAIVHIEGYLLFNPDVFKAAISAARSAGALVSLDLASFTVVEASKSLIDEALDAGQVDILIANEDETAAFTGVTKDKDEAAKKLGRRVGVAVMNMGKLGSNIIADGGKTMERVGIHGDGRAAVDTTGAGDLFIAGFLYGIVNGYNLGRCGELGAMCGYEVCQVTGAHIPDEGWARIKS